MAGVNTVACVNNFGVAAGPVGRVVYYLVVHRCRPVTVLAEHRADVAPSGVGAVGEEA